jgi:hypothetical protein
MDEPNPKYEQLPDLIDECYPFMSKEEQDALDLAQESMSFFCEVEAWERLTYEYEIMYRMLKGTEF